MVYGESARRNHPASDGEPIREEAARIATPHVPADALVDQTEARKDAGHAHAVGGTEPGIIDPTSEAPGPGSPAPCRGSAATGRRGRSAIPPRCGRRGKPPCR